MLKVDDYRHILWRSVLGMEIADFVSICAISFAFQMDKKVLIWVIAIKKRKEEKLMNATNETVKRLEEENRKLKEDNEMLLNIVVQMKVTLNRLVSHYVAER